MKILVCNAGSTSLKFKLFEMPEEKVLARSTIERVGDPNGGQFRYFCGDYSCDTTRPIGNYAEGINTFLEYLTDKEHGAVSAVTEIGAIGFKTVLSKNHYGVHIIDESVMQGMRDFMSVAPAHNSHYIEAVKTFAEILPDVPMVGAFETAFHQTMPEESFLYSGPYEWYEKYGIRRFGYHGASHSYIADCLNTELGNKYRAVSCHLGGSSSLCAVINGKSYDTSFGMSLQCGLPQSNRTGDFDPFIINHLINDIRINPDDLFSHLSKNSGLLGISGKSKHLIDLINTEDTDERSALAIRIYIKELVRYIGGYAAEMGGIDAIVFTAGIGENSEPVRNRVMERLAFLGIEKAPDKRPPEKLTPETGAFILTEKTSKVRVYVIPANEELGVARKTFSKISE